MTVAGSTSSDTNQAGLGWLSVARIGLVQACLGAFVMLTTTVLNRLMVVEYQMAAAIPAGLVAWHYAVQLSRPLFGHGADTGRKRTPWIIGGMIVLAGASVLASHATLMLAGSSALGLVLAVIAYSLIGAGVGASGTSALALLASSVAPDRRPAAAAVTWIMMIAGIVFSAITVGEFLKPFSPERLMSVTIGLAIVCVTVTVLATFRLEKGRYDFAETAKDGPVPDFRAAISEILSEPAARRFTIFIFVSMIAFSMQDLILEPFAGLVYGMTPGESTQLGGMHQGGILIGMIFAGVCGSAFKARLPSDLRIWIVTGCLASAIGLAGLAAAAVVGPGWPIQANVFVLGLGNGVFAVSAIGAMMGLAGAGAKTREGVRMGVWGASQAIAFGLGGLLGAGGRDFALRVFGNQGSAFQLIFAIEAALFVLAAILAVRATSASAAAQTKNGTVLQSAGEKEVFA